MAATASKEQLIPKVGLRFSLRFQAVSEEEQVLSRASFCRNVIMGQLRLKVEDVFCIQWNQQEKAFDVTLRSEDVYRRVAEVCEREAKVRHLASYQILSLDRPNFRTITLHMFNPFVTDIALADFLGQYGEVVSSARYVKDPMGFWTGRRQYQVLLNPDPEGPGGLKHPPAFFSLGGDRGFLYYSRQPAFCRRCRVSGHTEAGCSGACCRFCGQGGHEAKDCIAPKACHGCGGAGHLYRSCPSRRRTFAEVAKMTGGIEKVKEPGKGPKPAGNVLGRQGQAEADAVASEGGLKAAPQMRETARAVRADSEAQVTPEYREGVLSILSPGPGSSKAKPGARRGSQVFGAGFPTEGEEGEGGDGHSKKTKGEGKGTQGQPKVGVVDVGKAGREGQQRLTAEEVQGDDVLEQGGGETGQEVGGEGIDSSNVDLGFDLSPGLLMLSSPLGEDAYDGPNRPASSPNTVPFSWAEEMDNEDLYSQ